MDSRTIIRLIEKDGWYKVGQKGDHVQFKHPTKFGKVTVIHPAKDYAPKTLRSMERQAGLKFR